MPVFYTFHNLRFKDTITKDETKKNLLTIFLDFLYEDDETEDGEFLPVRFYHTEEDGFWQELLDSLKDVFGDNDGLRLFTMVDEWQLCKWEEQGDKVIPINGLALLTKSKKGIYKKKEDTSKEAIMEKLRGMLPEGAVEQLFKEDEEE